MEFIKHILTGKDNTTHDAWKWSFVLSFFFIGGAAIYLIYGGHQISLTELASAFGINAGAHAAGVAGKQLAGAEPDVPSAN